MTPPGPISRENRLYGRFKGKFGAARGEKCLEKWLKMDHDQNRKFLLASEPLETLFENMDAPQPHMRGKKSLVGKTSHKMQQNGQIPGPNFFSHNMPS